MQKFFFVENTAEVPQINRRIFWFSPWNCIVKPMIIFFLLFSSAFSVFPFFYCGGSNSYSSFLYRSNFESRGNHGCQIVGNPRITLETEKLQVKRTHVNIHTEKLNCTLQIMYLGILLNQEEK